MRSLETQPYCEARVKSPRTAILEAAEQLFAAHGYDGVTLRDVTVLAGTNIASVNYYFGSKEDMFREMIGRRFRSLCARQVELLQAETSQGGRPQLERLLDAFGRPFFENTGLEGDELLRRMIVRTLMETDGLAVRVFKVELLPGWGEFVKAIGRSRPELTPQQIVFGLVFFSGAMIRLLASLLQVGAFQSAIDGFPDHNEMLHTLVRCGVAAFDALPEARLNGNCRNERPLSL